MLAMVIKCIVELSLNVKYFLELPVIACGLVFIWKFELLFYRETVIN